MAEVLLFHHAQGQTAGFLAFADDLRAAGHVVHAPDLYDGETFAELTDGQATVTCSPIAASPTSMKKQRRCSRSASSRS
jgi:dienelactone hydrolase